MMKPLMASNAEPKNIKRLFVIRVMSVFYFPFMALFAEIGLDRLEVAFHKIIGAIGFGGSFDFLIF